MCQGTSPVKPRAAVRTSAPESSPISTCQAHLPFRKMFWQFPVCSETVPTVSLCPTQDPADSPGKSPQNASSHSAPLLSTGGSELSEAIGPPCLSSEFISTLPPVLSLYPSIPSLPIKVSSCLLNSLYHLLLWPHLATYPCVYYLRWNSSGYIPGFTLNCLIFRMVSVGVGFGFGFFCFCFFLNSLLLWPGLHFH